MLIKSILILVKDLTISRESPGVSSYDLLNKIQKIGMFDPQKDIPDTSKTLEHPTSEDSGDLNSSLDGISKVPVCPRMPPEHKFSGKRKSLSSNQEVEHYT